MFISYFDILTLTASDPLNNTERDVKTLKLYIPVIVSSIVTIFSIFISNYLGQKSSQNTHKFSNAEKTYVNFYIPLIRWIALANKDESTYFWLVAIQRYGPLKQQDKLTIHLLNNLEYAPPIVASKIQKYNISSSGAQFF